MSQRASILIDFKTQGAADVKRAIAGIVNENRRASTEAKRAADAEKSALRAKSAEQRKVARDAVAADRSAKKQIESQAKASTKSAANEAKLRAAAQRAALKAESDAVRAAEKIKRDEVKRTSAEVMRIRQAEHRELLRLFRQQQRQGRQQERERGQRQRQARQTQRDQDASIEAGMVGVGGAVLGTGMMLAGAAMAYGAENNQRARQWIGLEDEDALIARYGEAHLQAKNTADQSRGARSVQDVEALMMRGANMYGVAPEVSGAMFAGIQDMYSDQAGAVVEHFDRINEISAAYQASIGGVAETGSIVMRDLGVTQDQMDEALESMAGSTGSGSVSMGDLSSQFGETPNLLRATFGDRSSGLQGAQQFAALAQISGRTGVQGDERATTLNRFLTELKDPETAKRLREATHGRVNIRDRRGQMLPMRQVLEALQSPELDRPGVTEDVFQSIPARTYLRGLRTGGMSIYDRLLSESNPEAGSEMIGTRMAGLQNDPAWLARLDVGRQASTVYQQAPELINRARQQTGYISEWNAANVGMPSMLRTPLTMAASGAEGIGGWLDSVTGDGSAGSWLGAMNRNRDPALEGSLGAAFGDMISDPRVLFRSLLGGDAAGLSGSVVNAGPAIGQSVAGANVGALVADIIRQTQQVAGGQAPGGNMRTEVTDPIVLAQRETARIIAQAISGISLPGPSVGGTTGPTQ